MSFDAALWYYVATSIGSAFFFSATSFLLMRKYKAKHNKLHLYAALAFIFLLIQEIVVAYWIIVSIPQGGIDRALRPWQIQAFSIFFAFTLLGLSMSGKIRD